MSKPLKSKFEPTVAVATPATTAPGNAEAPGADTTAASAALPEAPAKPTAFAKRALTAVQKLLQGTRVERLAKRAEDAVNALPRRLESELDLLLDRVGLVRKSRAGQGAPVGPEVAAKPA